MLAALAVLIAIFAQPNVVWIVIEDMSADFGCYGKPYDTPHIDALADRGVRFINAVTTAPVCSPARSALITGCYQTAIGAHQHRSGRGEVKILLPDPVRTMPELMRDAGYHVSNVNLADFTRDGGRVRVAKTDYNFSHTGLYDTTHWADRPEGTPFFAQVQLPGGKLRGHGNGDAWPSRVEQTLGSKTDPADVRLPPTLPDDPVIREDWAQYLDTVRFTDMQVGRVIDRLRDAGELDTTVIMLITDHGVSHVRHKQYCYEGGIRIPMIIAGPGINQGVRADPVEHISLAPTTLSVAGRPIPRWMHARDLFGDNPRAFALSARDRCDETIDRIRSIRTHNFKYIRNFYPDQPYLAPNAYKDAKPIIIAMRRLHADGKLDEAQSLIMADHRPAEELYYLPYDPHETRNLAGDPAHANILRKMRQAMDAWLQEHDTLGPEPEAQYDSDMAVYLRNRAGKDDTTIQHNIDVMKRWAY